MRDVGGPNEADGPGNASSLQAGSRVSVWGVLNVTPDSFSDGGVHFALDRALARADALLAEGADVIDVGGESSRPAGITYGSPQRVSEDEELRRVIPVVEVLAARGIMVSIDTTKPAVAARALAAGARILNDVGGGRDEALVAVAAQAGAELVLMHNRGDGQRRGENIVYGDVVADVRAALLRAASAAESLGVQRARIWLDPGIGFAKTAAQSLALLAHTDALVATGYGVLVGPSRKSFIADTVKRLGDPAPPPLERLGGTIAAIAVAVFQGARAIRVHDVRDCRQAATLARAVREARR